ncbi:MAG: hypothetical protein Kow0059_14450 [Candidatus Sumerlaeia bacterium]
MPRPLQPLQLNENYASSVTFWRFVLLVVLCGFVTVLGVGFVYLRFKVRDLKIAINSTEQRIENLRERENAVQAAIQARAHEWTLKQTAAQTLGMIDFNPQQIVHVEYPERLVRRYAEASGRFDAERTARNRDDLIRRVLMQLKPLEPQESGGGKGREQGGRSTAESSSLAQAPGAF